MIPDGELLRQYAAQGSEAAFAELVRRHVDLVYSVALRQAAGDTALAQDATQLVFIDLARKARVLCGHSTLAGWLHTSARFAASKAIRGEQRRRVREQESLAMNENPATAEMNWEQLRPLLDESVGQLKEADRDAIVLRFFQGKNHQEIGKILGLSENSANKRVERALEKLRGYFAKRGVKASSALLATAITANSVQAAPAGLAEKVTPVSLAGAGGTASGIFLKILFMSTQVKILAAAAVIVAIALTVTLNWPQTAPQPGASATSPIAAQPTTAPVPIKPAVQTPAAKPAMAAAISPTTNNAPAFVAGPQADLKTAIATGLHFLDAHDTLSFFKTLMPPEAIAGEGKGNTVEEFVAQISQDPRTEKKISSMQDAMKAIEGQPPQLNSDDTRATYQLDPPVGGHKAVIFNKVGGFWYLDGM